MHHLTRRRHARNDSVTTGTTSADINTHARPHCHTQAHRGHNQTQVMHISYQHGIPTSQQCQVHGVGVPTRTDVACWTNTPRADFTVAQWYQMAPPAGITTTGIRNRSCNGACPQPETPPTLHKTGHHQRANHATHHRSHQGQLPHLKYCTYMTLHYW